MAVVTLVNVKILTSTHSYTLISLFLSIGSICLYILAYWLLNLLQDLDIYMTFYAVFFHGSFYFALAFCSCCLVMIDIGLNLVH